MPNKNDFLYLQYCELLLQAKEYGLGYRVEYKDVLHLVPTPLVKIDNQNRFHNEHGWAIHWKGAKKFYYLHGVKFPENLYKEIISREMSMDEILKIEDIDQRMQAMKFAKTGIREFYLSQHGKKIDEINKLDKENRIVHYELWEIPSGDVFNQIVHFMLYDCPSAQARGEKREYAKGVPPFKTCAEAMSWGMSDDVYQLTSKEWKQMIPLIHES